MTEASLRIGAPGTGPGACGARAGGWRRYVLDIVLFAFTLGIGWLIWLLVVGGRGQNPAKQLLGVHVVRADGSRAGLGLMLLREIVAKWAVFAVISYVLSLANADVGSLHVSAGIRGGRPLVYLGCEPAVPLGQGPGRRTWSARGDAPAGVRVTSQTERTAENLQTLQDLHARGLLTDEEYEERRARELERL